MNDHDDSENMAEPTIGWRLLLLHQCVNELHGLAGGLAEALQALDPEVITGGGKVELSVTGLDRIMENLEILQDQADLAGSIGGSLGAQREAVALDAGDLREQAERALRMGTGHSASVMLSASLLSPRVGFPALANAITVEPELVSEWGSLTIRDLLSRFHGGNPALTRRICVASDLHADTEWATLDMPELDRLARQLRGAVDV